MDRSESIEGVFLVEHGGDGDGISQRLLRLTTEPARFRVLVLLNDRPATLDEIAKGLGLDQDIAAGHLEGLCEEGLVEVGEPAPEGGDEPSYRALVRTLWDDEEWAELSVAERKRLTAWTIEWIYTELRTAVDAGTFNARPDSHCSRSVAWLDEQGWQELTRIQEEALDAIFAVHALSAERLAERGEGGVPVLSSMICCELPSPLGGEQG